MNQIALSQNSMRDIVNYLSGTKAYKGYQTRDIFNGVEFLIETGQFDALEKEGRLVYATAWVELDDTTLNRVKAGKGSNESSAGPNALGHFFINNGLSVKDMIRTIKNLLVKKNMKSLTIYDRKGRFKTFKRSCVCLQRQQ